MIYPIVIYGNSVLSSVAKPITPEYPELPTLLDDMFKTLTKSGGVGLAAPQIGLSIQLFILDFSVMADEDPAYATFKKVFINPEIVHYSEETEISEEGCLSVPGLSERVKRSLSVTIKYMDENWQEHTETYSGFPARAIQHEYDHLQGKVYVDKISPIRRQLINSKLSAISKGKVSCHYKVKR
jgi:peptide deformylase